MTSIYHRRIDTQQDAYDKSHRTRQVSITETNRLMLFRKITNVYSEIHPKYFNIHCGQNAEIP
jgi:hypothetical protein